MVLLTNAIWKGLSRNVLPEHCDFKILKTIVTGKIVLLSSPVFHLYPDYELSRVNQDQG